MTQLASSTGQLEMIESEFILINVIINLDGTLRRMLLATR